MTAKHNTYSLGTVFKGMWQGRPVGCSRPKGMELCRMWWKACRPPFLIVDLIPIALGLALAVRDSSGSLSPVADWPWFRCFLVVIGCFCVHTVANIADDLFDYLLGIDTEDSIGGTGVIQSGAISPREITCAIIFLLAVAVVIGWVLLKLSHQYWLIPFVIFAVLSAVFYVAPPICYGHKGYGELLVAVNMGFIMVCGTYAVLAGRFDAVTLAYALPVGLMVAGILFFQSLPEIETDESTGKNTLAVHLGKTRAKLVFDIWWPLVWGFLINLWLLKAAGWPVLLGLLTIPLYLLASRRLHYAVTSEEWLDLDRHGHLVRKLYLLNGLALVLGTFFSV